MCGASPVLIDRGCATLVAPLQPTASMDEVPEGAHQSRPRMHPAWWPAAARKRVPTGGPFWLEGGLSSQLLRLNSSFPVTTFPYAYSI